VRRRGGGGEVNVGEVGDSGIVMLGIGMLGIVIPAKSVEKAVSIKIEVNFVSKSSSEGGITSTARSIAR